MRTSVALAAVIAVIGAVASCSPSGDVEQASPAGDGRPAGGSLPVTSAADTPAGAAAPGTPNASSGDAQLGGAIGGAGTTAPPSKGQQPVEVQQRPSVTGAVPLEATVTPSCAKRGDVVAIQVTTRRHASIAAAGTYANGESYDSYTIGDADASGKWSWPLRVPASAAYGDVKVDVMVQDRTPSPSGEEASTNGETSHGVFWFTVRRSC